MFQQEQKLDVTTRSWALYTKIRMATKKWEYQYSSKRNLLYKKHANLHQIHDFKKNSRQWTRSEHRVKLFEPKFEKIIEKLPSDNIPVDGTHNNKAIKINSITTIINEKIHHPPKTWKI